MQRFSKNSPRTFNPREEPGLTPQQKVIYDLLKDPEARAALIQKHLDNLEKARVLEGVLARMEAEEPDDSAPPPAS